MFPCIWAEGCSTPNFPSVSPLEELAPGQVSVWKCSNPQIGFIFLSPQAYRLSRYVPKYKKCKTHSANPRTLAQQPTTDQSTGPVRDDHDHQDGTLEQLPVGFAAKSLQFPAVQAVNSGPNPQQKPSTVAPPRFPHIPYIHPPLYQPLCRFVLNHLKPQQSAGVSSHHRSHGRQVGLC